MAKGIAFDVGTVLEVGSADNSPLPEAGDGEIILRVPEGISLAGLRDSTIGGFLMHWQQSYEQFDWSRQPLAAGIYKVRLPIPGSNFKTFEDQRFLLMEHEQVASVTLAAIALLCLRMCEFPDPLNDGFVRCAASATTSVRVALCWFAGRLRVFSGNDDLCLGHWWLAASRTS
jgi:hypothetical protein